MPRYLNTWLEPLNDSRFTSMAKLNFQAKQVRHDTEFTSGPGISRAGSHWVRGRGRGRTRLWPSPPCQPPLLPHPHIHPHVAICSQTCHVFPCCLPLRKLLPLPKMLLFNLFESSFWKTSVHPTRLSSTPLLKAFCYSPGSFPSSLSPNTHKWNKSSSAL